jgi:hypothetical protein
MTFTSNGRGRRVAIDSRRHRRGRSRKLTGVEGIDFVRCRICSEYLRVISGRHLSKHGTDRQTYMEEYRLSPDELIAKDVRIIQSSHRGYHPYGKREWIAAIKKIYDHGGSVFAGELQDTYPHLYTQGVWIFGDWDDALRAAGFDPERTRMRSSWNKERITRELRRLRKENLPLYPNYVMKNHQKLFSIAVRQYGSWNKALSAAGIKNIPSQTRLGLLRSLRDAIEARNEISTTLRSALEYYFGNLPNAKIAMKTDKRFLSGWSNRKIIAVLAQRHRLNEKLDYATGRREFPALVSAAEAYFGSWGKALYAAGIDPNLYFVHHRWRKTKPNRQQTSSP